jgi:hypothetical protein
LAHLIGLSSFARFCCWHRGTDDLVAGSHALEPSHWLSRREALEKFPMLRHAGLKGATVYYDGQMNDSRVCVAVAQTAIAHGAACVNHTEVVRLLHRTETVPSSPSSLGLGSPTRSVRSLSSSLPPMSVLSSPNKSRAADSEVRAPLPPALAARLQRISAEYYAAAAVLSNHVNGHAGSEGGNGHTAAAFAAAQARLTTSSISALNRQQMF